MGFTTHFTECAAISKWAGGIGLHIHDVRASGSRIRGTNGQSDGIIPMLRGVQRHREVRESSG